MSHAKHKPNLEALQAKQRRQSRLIDFYKRQHTWVVAGACAIVLLALLFTGLMGYATNWWQNPTKTSQFGLTPQTGAGTVDGASSAATPSGTVSTGSGGGSSQSGGSSTAKETNSTTTNNTSTSDKTTSTNTTTNTTNNTNTGNTTDEVSSALKTLYNDAGLGSNINDLKARADEQGVGYNCTVTLLTVQECTFSQGGNSFTTKNLITNPAITGQTGII